MVINTVYETSYTGMYKITAQMSEGEEVKPFFIRKQYLINVDFEKIDNGSEFNDEETGELLDAGIACFVELKALEYIARCEQNRFGLTRKLLEKGFEKKYVDMALDLLESTDYLSDERFSRAWLHSRSINHYEGRSKLIAELQSRGINKDIAGNAVNEFFSENDEEEICFKAYQKFIKKGKSDDKLITAMMQAGFSYKQIKAVLNKSTCSENLPNHDE